MTPEMVIKTSHEPPVGVSQQFRFVRGEVYTSVACRKVAPLLHGQNGFRVVGDADVPVLEQVVFWVKDGFNGWITMGERAGIRVQRKNSWLAERAIEEFLVRERRRDGLDKHSSCLIVD